MHGREQLRPCLARPAVFVPLVSKSGWLDESSKRLETRNERSREWEREREKVEVADEESKEYTRPERMQRL